MVELVDTSGLGPDSEILSVGSSPTESTISVYRSAIDRLIANEKATGLNPVTRSVWIVKPLTPRVT